MMQLTSTLTICLLVSTMGYNHDNRSSGLKCTVDTSLLHIILSDIESMGYQTHKAFVLNQLDGGANLAPNTGGGYANYVRSFNNNSLPYVYKMNAPTAILFHGCTPPKSQYFGYSSTLYMDNGMWVWSALGDVLNNRVIKTYNHFHNAPFDDLTTIITTADLQTYEDITHVYNNSGITESMINLDPIPFDLITQMGTAHNSSSFHTFVRVSIPHNNSELQYYFDHINTPKISHLYFITKTNDTNQFIPNDPVLKRENRDRICSNSSYPYSGNEYELESQYNVLINSTISEMQTHYRFLNRSMKIYGTEYDGVECIQKHQLCGATTPDAIYYEDYNNQSAFIQGKNGSQNEINGDVSGYLLRDDNLFMIMGINHYNLGLSSYNQETIYNETFSALKNTKATLNNFQYNNSARYLEQIAFGEISNIFYSIMYVRPGQCVKKLVENGVICVEIEYDDLKAEEGFIVFSRAYLNPCTDTGLAKNQSMYEMFLEFDHIPLNEHIDDRFALIVGVTIGAVVFCIALIFALMYLFSDKDDDYFHPNQCTNQRYGAVHAMEMHKSVDY